MAYETIRRIAKTLVLTIATVVAIAVTSAGPASASPRPASSVPASQSIVIDSSQLSAQAQQFMQVLPKLYPELALTNGKLTLKRSMAELTTTYHLTTYDVVTLTSMLAFSAQHPVTHNATAMTRDSSVGPELSAQGTVIYFTKSDIFIWLLAAAQTGPEAVAVALDFIATVFGGPIGTAIGTILDIIGFATLANFTYLILQAAWAGEGVYFGIEWTPWPNYVQGLWCGCD